MSILDAVRVSWARVGDGMLRREVAWNLVRELAPGAVLSNPCPRCGGPHGPVQVRGAAVVASVAYAGRFAFAAVADAARLVAVGVDAEVDAAAPAGLDDILPAPADRRSWVRVEAVVKADRRGLRIDPRAVAVRETATGWTARLPDRAALFSGLDVTGPPGVLVSLAGLPRDAS